MSNSLPKTVLIVEEEDNLRVLVRDILAKQGYRMFEAADAKQALQLCVDNPKSIHLMVTDLVLREASGVVLAKQARTWQPGMKTLFLEDHSESTMISLGIPLSDLQYLKKPVKLKELVAKVEEMLGDTPASGPPKP